MRVSHLALATFVCALSAAAPVASQSSGYHLTRHIPVAGDGGWDYLTFDTAYSRIFISRGTHVQVLDPRSGSLVGDIPNTGGVHGIALAYELGKGFTSNGRDTTVTVFDLKTLAPTATVRVTGANPDAILYDPSTQRVFTFNGRGESTTAIDARTNAVVGTLALGGKPETAIADGMGHVFVNIEDKSTIVEFDARNMTIMHTYPLAPGEGPSGLAYDPSRHLLFAGCEKMMCIMDATTGRIVATPPTDQGTDANGFDPGTGYAFASNGAGTLTVVHQTNATTFTSENIPTERGARTMTLDPKTHTVYLVTAKYNPMPATAPGEPRQRPTMVPGSFEVLVVSR